MKNAKKRGRPFRPGCAPGPGRPKGAGEFRAQLRARVAEGGQFDAVVDVLLRAARRGKGWAVKELFDRCCDKAAQPVNLDGQMTGRLVLPMEAIRAAKKM